MEDDGKMPHISCILGLLQKLKQQQKSNNKVTSLKAPRSNTSHKKWPSIRVLLFVYNRDFMDALTWNSYKILIYFNFWKILYNKIYGNDLLFLQVTTSVLLSHICIFLLSSPYIITIEITTCTKAYPEIEVVYKRTTGKHIIYFWNAWWSWLKHAEI